MATAKKQAKRGPGRPSTLTPEARQEQLRVAQAAHRQRQADEGRVRLDITVEPATKAALTAYREAHGLPNLGVALDKILEPKTGKKK